MSKRHSKMREPIAAGRIDESRPTAVYCRSIKERRLSRRLKRRYPPALVRAAMEYIKFGR